MSEQWMILLREYRSIIHQHYLEEIGCRAYPVNDPPPDKLPNMSDIPIQLVARARIGGIADAIDQSHPLDIALAFCVVPSNGYFDDSLYDLFAGEDAEVETAHSAYRNIGIRRN